MPDDPIARVVEPVFTAADRDMLTALSHAVFGLPGDDESGLLHAMRLMAEKLDRIYTAVMLAALSFGFGSIAVVVAIVAVS